VSTTSASTRYPVHPRSGHQLVVRVLAVGVAAGLALLVYTRFGGTDKASGKETGFDLVDDSTLSLRFDVTRSDPSIPVVCIVRSRSIDGSETGRRQVYVPPGTETLTSMEVLVRSSLPPVAGNVYGCGTTVPGYLVPAP
jgi:hypothetical protein